MREALIQKQIKDYLEKNGWMVIKLIQTSMNGIPDLLCLKQGKTVFLEIKQPGKTPNDLQKYRIEKLKKQGFDALSVTSVTDVSNYLTKILCL